MYNGGRRGSPGAPILGATALTGGLQAISRDALDDLELRFQLTGSQGEGGYHSGIGVFTCTR